MFDGEFFVWLVAVDKYEPYQARQIDAAWEKFCRRTGDRFRVLPFPARLRIVRNPQCERVMVDLDKGIAFTESELNGKMTFDTLVETQHQLHRGPTPEPPPKPEPPRTWHHINRDDKAANRADPVPFDQQWGRLQHAKRLEHHVHGSSITEDSYGHCTLDPCAIAQLEAHEDILIDRNWDAELATFYAWQRGH